MKYQIKFSCGHIEERHLFGKHKDRERKILWLENQNCTTCFRAAAAKEIEEQSVSLPILIGSERQIAWAKKIRGDLLKKFSDSELKELEDEKDDLKWEELLRFVKKISSTTQAIWLINHRDIDEVDFYI